jgi:hypothetical protein
MQVAFFAERIAATFPLAWLTLRFLAYPSFEFDNLDGSPTAAEVI